MSIWDNLTSLFRREAGQASGQQTPRRGAVSFYGSPGVYASDLSIATVYCCADLLGNSVASLRMRYLVHKGGVYAEEMSSPYHYLLTVQPQPEMSAHTFWSLAVQQMLLCGNAYIYPRLVMGELTDLVLCQPRCVSHDCLNGTYTVVDNYSGVYGTFTEQQMIHLFVHTPDGLTGESVISHARRTMDIAHAGDTETENRFTNGGNVRGLVTNDRSVVGFGQYQDEQLDRTATDIDGRFRRGERIVSLPGQVEFRQISLSSTDMQFLESRKFTVREICRFFRVHPSFVFDDSASNYKSAEMANVAFLSTTLNPLLKRIESEFNRKLVPRQQCCNCRFEFDRRDVYSLDLDSLANYQLKTIQSGVYTVNDWRRRENQPEVEGGDTVYISTNLAPITAAGMTTTQNTEP